MKAGRALTAATLALLAAVWGFCFALRPQAETAGIQAITFGSEDGESDQVLHPGESAESGVMFRNTGRTSCRLRVRLCAESLDGKTVLQAGDMIDGGFVEAGSAEARDGEYWTAKGEYLYYQNRATGDLLLPGQETPPAYSAVRLNDSLDPEALEALRQIDGSQKLFVLAQAQPEGEGGWQNALAQEENRSGLNQKRT